MLFRSIETPQDVATLMAGGVPLATWDATNTDGRKVSNGTYYIKVQSTDPFGGTTTVTQDVTVNMAPSSLVLKIFNSVGEVVLSLDTQQIEALLGGANLTAADYAVGSAKISSGVLSPSFNQPGAAGACVTITLGSGESFVWNGVGGDGQMVKPGNYYLELQSILPNTVAQQITWDIVVMPMSGGPAGKTALWPNPIRLDQTQTALFKINVTSPLVDNVEIHIYTLAGERMNLVIVNDPGNISQATWNLAGLNIASGVYIAEIELKSGNQLLTRQLLQIAVLH